MCHFATLRSDVASPAKVTMTAASSGDFTAVSTWNPRRVPTASDVVTIPSGIVVTVNNSTAVANTVTVDGTLKFRTDANVKLRVENLLIAANAWLIVGNAASPITSGYTATIAIMAPTPNVTDTLRMGRGIIAATNSHVTMNSARIPAPFVALSGSAVAGQSVLSTAAVPSGWEVGDQVVVAATVFTREWAPNSAAFGTLSMQNEVRTIAATTSSSVTLKAPLTYNHSLVSCPVNTPTPIAVHMANLSRSIIIKSEDPSSIGKRGHVMLMSDAVSMNGVKFLDLGRTDKRAIVSDPLLPASGVWNVADNSPNNHHYNNPPGDFDGISGPYSNPRARYSLHFHEAGTASENIYGKPAVISNCVVDGTPGWGFVNHDSDVDFEHNVCFDFDGAGFACEDGTETGTFNGNIALGGLGTGEFSNVREVFGNTPRVNQGDMGFNGSAFWFQSADITVTNNIAAGCKGSGFFFWCAAKFDPIAQVSPVTGLPNGAGQVTQKLTAEVAALKAYRAGLSGPYSGSFTPAKWPNGNALTNTLPIRKFSNNTAYGCFTGLRFRFVNQLSGATFTIRKEEFPTGQPHSNGGFVPGLFQIADCTFWNNLNGIHGDYLLEVDFNRMVVIADQPRRAYVRIPTYAQSAGVGAMGISVAQAVGGIRFNNCFVGNYTTGVTAATGLKNSAGGVDGIAFSNCFEKVSSGDPLGRAWFRQVGSTNNIPDGYAY